jgi:hypothetical protein
MVKEHQMNAYLLSVKRDRARVGKSIGEKHPGGRPESPHWVVVDAEIIRTLAGRGPMQSGEIQQVAVCVYNRLKDLISVGREPIPKPETIAQRLRKILKLANDFPTVGERLTLLQGGEQGLSG